MKKLHSDNINIYYKNLNNKISTYKESTTTYKDDENKKEKFFYMYYKPKNIDNDCSEILIKFIDFLKDTCRKIRNKF